MLAAPEGGGGRLLSLGSSLFGLRRRMEKLGVWLGLLGEGGFAPNDTSPY